MSPKNFLPRFSYLFKKIPLKSFLIFLSANDKKITKNEKKRNSREIDSREPLPMVDRKLACPVITEAFRVILVTG